MTTRALLTAKGYLDAEGNGTPAGEAWTDEQIAALRRQARRLKGGARTEVPRPLQPATIYNNVDQKGDADGYSI